MKLLMRRRAALATLCLPLLFAVPMAARAAAPKAVRMAVVVASGPESAWDGTFIKALAQVAAAHPKGLDFSYKVSDPLWGDDAENAMRLYAQSGKFDIIWAHSSYIDQVRTLKNEFPNIMFVVVGSGNEGLGGNLYWVYKRVYEPAYLLGIMAGKTTKTNTIGVVGTFPADDVNDEINAFLAGARSANPAVAGKVAFIESWFDPAKAAENMNAQVAAGADVIFTLADNFAPCDEHKIVCIGNFRDDAARSQRIISAPMALWDADITAILTEWYRHKSDGTAFDGNKSIAWLDYAHGGSAVAPFHDRQALVGPQAIAAFDAARTELLAGKIKAPLDVSLPVSK